MTSPGERIGVAVSGGADSVVLLYVLHQLASFLEVQLMVLHLNHQLRAEESEGDEKFVRELAASLGVPFLIQRANLGAGNLEQQARDARREFFMKAMAEHSLSRVALGHTRSDQAETVLFRFLRGSGTAGLAGMRPSTAQGLIRPMLGVSREEVREYAAERGIVWREDSTNLDVKFARNRLRLDVMPLLRNEANPNIEAVLAGTADLAQAEEDYWNQQIEQIYPTIAKRTRLGSFFQIADLFALHPAVQRRIIRKALVDLRGDLRSIDLSHVDAVLAICNSAHGHDRVMIPGVDAQRSFGTLLLAPSRPSSQDERHYHVDLQVGTGVDLPYSAGRISLRQENLECQDCANFVQAQPKIEVVYLDGDALTGSDLPEQDTTRPIYVRNWEPGDELQRAGHREPQKVKYLFQEFKVLLWERRHWPVVVSGNEIAWARQFGCASKFSASAKSVRKVCLEYERPDA